MSKKLIEDADQAFEAWKDSPTGSYLERTLADSIVKDLFPSLLSALKNKQDKTGFEKKDDK